MSIAHDNIPFDSTYGHLPLPPISVPTEKRPLHRIADVRRRQGISVRSAARRMHTSIDQVRRQEDPATDMLLSELLRWHPAVCHHAGTTVSGIDAGTQRRGGLAFGWTTALAQ
jgi:hypothetical protein